MDDVENQKLQKMTMNVTEAAKVLGISRLTAYARVHDGTIPSVRVGKRILVPRAKLYAMLEGV